MLSSVEMFVSFQISTRVKALRLLAAVDNIQALFQIGKKNGVLCKTFLKYMLSTFSFLHLNSTFGALGDVAGLQSHFFVIKK